MAWGLAAAFNAGNEIKDRNFDVTRGMDNELQSNYIEGDYSVVGINANKIPAMRDAIRQYVDNVTSNIDAIDPLAGADGAFKSDEVQAAVKKYIEGVRKAWSVYVSGLLAFSDKLQYVYEAYQTNINRVASNYDNMASAVDSKEKYTEHK